jgi:hypothetical protein
MWYSFANKQPAMAKSVIIFFHDFNIICFLVFRYSLTVPKFILENNVALKHGK